jgi:hypothetical protein
MEIGYALQETCKCEVHLLCLCYAYVRFLLFQAMSPNNSLFSANGVFCSVVCSGCVCVIFILSPRKRVFSGCEW